jgi:hypothetical protein
VIFLGVTIPSSFAVESTYGGPDGFLKNLVKEA